MTDPAREPSPTPPQSAYSWASTPTFTTSEPDTNADALLTSESSPAPNNKDASLTKRNAISQKHRPEEISDHDHASDSDSGTASPPSRDNEAGQPLLISPTSFPVVEPESSASGRPRSNPVTWMSLPRKDQLAILTLARLSEPLTQTSLQSYMFYQLRSFSPSASDSSISQQAGMLQAAFTGAQFCTAILWGRMADSERMGRKKVVLIGLFGTAVGALGFGFSKSFVQALLWRALGGALNGNIGVMRTMISEIIREKKFQSRAFLLLPMTFNVGVIIGPILGGLLADPEGSYPGLFGPKSIFGGEDGVWWMREWPYALPNLVSAVFLTCSAIALLLGLEESLETLRDQPDHGLRLGRWISRTVFRRGAPSPEYTPVSSTDTGDIEMTPTTPTTPSRPKVRNKLPFRRMWTPNVLFTFLAHGLLACHVGTFNSIWFVFCATPRYNPDHNTPSANDSLRLSPNYRPRPPVYFTGGLALPPARIGTALAILGVIGISLQLLLYPWLSFRLGTVRSFRLSLCLFPLAYFLAPFLAIVPSSDAAPNPASGPWLWMAITSVLCVQVMARTFALPASAILINNASPHPSVLGTIHGCGQTVSSAMRTFGPIIMSSLYGVGLQKGVVGLAWWCMAGLAVVGAIAAGWVREGDGHEIWLEGEREEADEEEAAAMRKD